MKKSPIERMGGRKIALGLLVVSVGVVVDMVAVNGLSTNLLDLLKFTAIGFFLSNVGEHAATALKSGRSTKGPNMDPVMAEMANIRQQIDATNATLMSVGQGVKFTVDTINQNTQRNP